MDEDSFRELWGCAGGVAPNYFISFIFLYWILDLPGGQINDPSMILGDTILFRSSQQLPRLSLGPLKGAVSAQ